MNRKEFLKLSSTLSKGLIAGSLLPACSNSPSQSIKNKLPKYWLWLRPDISLNNDEWKQIFEEIRGLGIEAILPEIYSSNMALFDTGDFQTKEPWLERMIPIAHQAGLQIHAWMWTMPCNNPKILSEHPEWYAVNRSGQRADTQPAYVPYYKFLCPRNPEVRAFIANRVKALSNISELDGIHLDYVRLPDVILAEGLQPNYDIIQDQEYPKYDYCYCPTCRQSYKAKVGIDPVDIADPASDKDWYQHRYDAVIELVNEYLVPQAQSKNKTITAAVFPNWQSVRQQWHKFNLDAFLPMLYHGFYNAEIQWIGQETEKSLERLDYQKPIYSGLFLPHMPSKVELTAGINSAINGGASGFSIFSYGDLNSEQKSALQSYISSQTNH